MMKAVLLPVLLLATLLQGSYSQKMSLGKCPYVKPKDPFWRSKFAGDWYEYSSYGEKINRECVKSEFLYNADTFSFNVIKNKGTADEVRGVLYHPTRYYMGEFNMEVNKPGGEPDITPYLILGTDYDSWAVAYTCTISFFRHYTSSWILTRERFPSINVSDVNPIISKIGLSMKNYKKTNQDGC